MFEFLTQHQFWSAVAIYCIFSAAVSSMPDPAPDGSPGLPMVFPLPAHGSRQHHDSLRQQDSRPEVPSHPPGNPHPALDVRLRPNNYVVHPGSVSQADSVGYDSLLIAQAAIDNARAAYEAGRLPDITKPAFNALVRSYNLAHQSWLTYRGAIQTNQPADRYFNQLNQNLINLSNALRTFEEVQ